MADIISTVGSGPGRDYATLNLWHTGRQLVHTDLVADGDNEIAECYDDGDPVETASFVVFGWTTDADNRVIVRAARGHQHDGISHLPRDATGNGAWITDTSVGAGSEAIEVYQNDTFLSGLRIVSTLRPAILVQGNGIQSGDQTAVVDFLVQAEAGGYGVGKINGPAVDATFVNCVVTGAGLGFSNTGIGDNNILRAINCTAINCNRSFSQLESSAPAMTMQLINCLSVAPRNHHYRIAFGAPLLIGQANIQDNSDVAGFLPDDEPINFPTFTEVPVVFEEDNPGPTAEQIILRRKDWFNPNTLRSEHNLVVGNGFPEPIAEQFLDINGLARSDADKHIGALVPVAAGPYVVLVNI